MLHISGQVSEEEAKFYPKTYMYEDETGKLQTKIIPLEQAVEFDNWIMSEWVKYHATTGYKWLP